ncbi:MAG: hypothetical protein ACO3FN_06045 [Vulcanococcus sp.]
MANTIKLRRSAVAGKTPAVGDLQLGELALNTYDGKLYTKKDNGTASIVELSGSAGPVTETPQVISSNYELSTGKNALSVGTVEIAATYTVTVPANATWVIV